MARRPGFKTFQRCVYAALLSRACDHENGAGLSMLNPGAKVPNGGGALTAVSRAAGMALTKVLAKENAGFNILVNGLLAVELEVSRERCHADTGLSLEEWYEDAAKQLK